MKTMISVMYKDQLNKSHSLYLKNEDIKSIMVNEQDYNVYECEIRLEEGKQIIFKGYDIIIGETNG